MRDTTGEVASDKTNILKGTVRTTIIRITTTETIIAATITIRIVTTPTRIRDKTITVIIIITTTTGQTIIIITIDRTIATTIIDPITITMAIDQITTRTNRTEIIKGRTMFVRKRRIEGGGTTKDTAVLTNNITEAVKTSEEENLGTIHEGVAAAKTYEEIATANLTTGLMRDPKGERAIMKTKGTAYGKKS